MTTEEDKISEEDGKKTCLLDFSHLSWVIKVDGDNYICIFCGFYISRRKSLRIFNRWEKNFCINYSILINSGYTSDSLEKKKKGDISYIYICIYITL